MTVHNQGIIWLTAALLGLLSMRFAMRLGVTPGWAFTLGLGAQAVYQTLHRICKATGSFFRPPPSSAAHHHMLVFPGREQGDSNCAIRSTTALAHGGTAAPDRPQPRLASDSRPGQAAATARDASASATASRLDRNEGLSRRRHAERHSTRSTTVKAPSVTTFE